jgi:uncharacterized FAD-dependent dehydrogenase
MRGQKSELKKSKHKFVRKFCDCPLGKLVAPIRKKVLAALMFI